MNDESFTWTIPPKASPPRRLVVLAVALMPLALGWLAFGRPVLGILGLLLILGSSADHLLPSTFTLDAKGATAKTGLSLAAMPWADVKRVLSTRDEVRLSPLERPSKLLDSTRGVGLVTTLENHEAVLAFIESHLPEGRGRPVL